MSDCLVIFPAFITFFFTPTLLYLDIWGMHLIHCLAICIYVFGSVLGILDILWRQQHDYKRRIQVSFFRSSTITTTVERLVLKAIYATQNTKLLQ
ncbi:hypothetical protein PLICRDRAFT_286929 [Plicaturopsis crispa FD-325 SS-3]|nr:hypothetical protein PLICRDRAFT_286929 [Plicaturopsis crispa FD-325 SS-3]